MKDLKTNFEAELVKLMKDLTGLFLLAANWGLSWEIPLGMYCCKLPDLHPQCPSDPELMIILVVTFNSTT